MWDQTALNRLRHQLDRSGAEILRQPAPWRILPLTANPDLGRGMPAAPEQWITRSTFSINELDSQYGVHRSAIWRKVHSADRI
ncbi:hypothetical protein OG777_25390 [Micromonospora peucetia]|uniref:Homeodomain-like domain-containing protein n=1 Tax=Micromonospora peucetia TaxID=47871 RepID=A0ABZ1EED3_9ACTN|nr:hypothetical protein [Micromonospora peucetia]MCX4390231.1 hypothetical protein [Micromonospora peucetia]WSA32460.1 hypothetical protein OIE14_30930 [Micromonospora peucetia]